MISIKGYKKKCRISFFCLVVVLISIVGCNFQSTLDAASYIKWIENENHGLRKTKTIGDIEYTLQYKPYEYIALYELKNSIPSHELINKRVKEIEGMSYFNMRIKHKKGGDIVKYNTTNADEFFTRSSYFSFEMQYDIAMVSGQDTLPCALFHEVKNYGIAPFVDFVIAFDGIPEREPTDKELIIQDRAFNNGLIKFHLAAKSFKNIPSLKL